MSNIEVEQEGSGGVKYSSGDNASQDALIAWNPILERLEERVSEAWLQNLQGNQSPPVNVFGRQVNTPDVSGDTVDYLSGMSLNGLRVAALVDADEALRQHAGITHAATKMLSWVQYLQIAPDQGSALLSVLKAGNGLSETGVFQLVSGSVQEALDFGVIAHRVAELALLPGLVMLDGMPDAVGIDSSQIPGPEKLRQYLGDPDDRIDCVTPFQRIVFGKTRRRIPNWFNFDHPTFHGPLKSSHTSALEAAARGPFLLDHMQLVVMQALEEFARVCGRQYNPVEEIYAEDAEFLVVLHGAVDESAREVLEELRSMSGAKVGLLRVRLIRPFPGPTLARMLSGMKAVTVLERTAPSLSENPPLLRDITSALNKAEENSRFGHDIHQEYPRLAPDQKPLLLSGVFGPGGGALTADELKAVYENMRNAIPGKSSFFGARQEIKPSFRTRFTLGVDFCRHVSTYPKLEVEANELRKQYPGLEKWTLPESPGPDKERKQVAETKEDTAFSVPELPLSTRRYRDEGPQYSRVSRFYNHTALLYQNCDEDQQTASPWQCVPSVPVATAGLINHSMKREMLPMFDPESCTGCGQCFIHCPHSAIPPLVASPETLLRTAAEEATARGTNISQITPALKGLGQTLGKELRDRKEPLSDLAEVMPHAFEKLLAQMKPEGDRKSTLEQEFQEVLDILKGFPLALTEPFFRNAEKQKRGSGELFGLAVDPLLCTGCGICVQNCGEEALRMETQTDDILDSLKTRFRFWEASPDTSAETLKRVLDDQDYPSFGALLLSRHFSMSIRGGDSSGTGASEQTLLHLISSVVESLVQPAVLGLADEVEKLKKQLAESIRNYLSDCLGEDHFAALSKTLSAEHGSRLPYDELIAIASDETPSSLVDLESLRRKIELEQALQNLKWVFHEGPSGVGRSRLSMMLQGGNSMDWAKYFPFHPFGFPVVLQWSKGVSEMALGLLHGHLRHYLDNIRLIRRAALESKGKYEPRRDDPSIGSLGWDDLSEEEKLAFPPLLIAATYDNIDERNVSELNALLSCELPVKLFLFDTLRAPANRTPEQCAWLRSKLLVGAMTNKNAFILQSSLAKPEHLYTGVVDGIMKHGPALFHLHAPNPDENPMTALESRVFPLLRFNPDKEGVFGVLLDLDGNPCLKQTWAVEQQQETVQDEEDKTCPALTFADWVFSKNEYRDHYIPVEEDSPGLIPLHEYLAMQESERQNKTPFISGNNEEGERPSYRVSESMINASRIIMEHWLLLQELNGTRTPFTEKIRGELKLSLEEQHQAELNQLRDEYEQRLVSQESEMLQKTREKIRERLMQLSNKRVEPVG